MSIKIEKDPPRSPYTPEEAVVIGYMKNLMGGEPYHTMETALLPAEMKARRTMIIEEITSLTDRIRRKELTIDKFFSYQDAHLEESDYQFLSQPHPGLNVTGWRVFMACIDPLRYGKTIDRSMATVRGTISHRSAKH